MPRRTSRCRICTSQESRYSCPTCLTPYCSVTCYKDHKSSCLVAAGSSTGPAEQSPPRPPPSLDATEDGPGSRADDEADDGVPDAEPLKPLTSLKWPYVPEEPSIQDPLKRDDPKPLRLHHYHAIATSPEVRSALSSNPGLPALLARLDALRGEEREEALEGLLGVADLRSDIKWRKSDRKGAPPLLGRGGGGGGGGGHGGVFEAEDEQKALKQLAEAVEKAIHGERAGGLGLEWADDARS